MEEEEEEMEDDSSECQERIRGNLEDSMEREIFKYNWDILMEEEAGKASTATALKKE
jgi:hypothetical protein